MSGYGRLYRKENLEKEHSLKRKHADAVPLLSVTSCAYHKDVWQGSHLTYFPSYCLPRLKSVSMHDNEKEMLLPGGVMVSYKSVPNKKNTFEAEIVNGLQFSERYWPIHAFYYAAEEHLNKEFQDDSDSKNIGGYKVHRPNHGGPHTYDTMRMVLVILEYFMSHAKDIAFSKFCREIDFHLFDWLQIAVAFSVTGRKSEIAFGDDPDLYFSYRLESQAQFRTYNSEFNPLNYDTQRELNVSRIDELILYMGNPNYQVIIQGKYDHEEIQIRLYLHRLITLAHKLDLPRCYSYRQFKQSISEFTNYITSSEDQHRGWIDLQRRAVAAIKSRGDCLQFMIDVDGSCIKYSQDYQPEFGMYSANPRKFVQFREIYVEDLSFTAKLQKTTAVPNPVQASSFAVSINTHSIYSGIASFDALLVKLPLMGYQERIDEILKKRLNGQNLLHYVASNLVLFKKVYAYIKNELWLDYLLGSAEYFDSPMQKAVRKPEVLSFILKQISDSVKYTGLLKPALAKKQFLLADAIYIPESFALIVNVYPKSILLNHLTLMPVAMTGKCVLSMLAYYPDSLRAVFKYMDSSETLNICLFVNDLMPESLMSMAVSLPETLKAIITSIPEYKRPLLWQDLDNSGYTFFFRSFYDLKRDATYSNPAGLELMLGCILPSKLEEVLSKKELNGISNADIIAYEPLNLRILLESCPRSILLLVFNFSANDSIFGNLLGLLWIPQNNNTILHQLVREFMNHDNKDYDQLEMLAESIMLVVEFLDEPQRRKYALEEFGPQGQNLLNIADSHFSWMQRYRLKGLLPEKLKELISIASDKNNEYFGKHVDDFMDVPEENFKSKSKKAKF